jgi:hypothetical protein
MLVWTSYMLDVNLLRGIISSKSHLDALLIHSVATGSKHQHKQEEATFLKEALGI